MSCAELYTEREEWTKFAARRLAGVPEQDDVALLDDVVLALEAYLSFFARGAEAAGGEQVVPADDFGADEAFFNVAVNGPGSFDGVRTLMDGPGPDFGFAGGEKRRQAHQIVGRVDQAVEARLLKAVGGEKLACFFVVHLGQLRFEPAADRDDSGVRTAFERAEPVALDRAFELAGLVVSKIQDVQHRTLRQEEKAADGFALFGAKSQLAQRLFGFKMRLAFVENGFFPFKLLVGLFL